MWEPVSHVRATWFRQAGLRNRLSVERRSPALIHVVIDAAALSVEELELATKALAVAILKCRQHAG